MFTDIRLKIARFFRKNGKIIFIIFSVWMIVFFINLFLKTYQPKPELQTTYEPHTAVMDTKSSVPKMVSNPIEEMIETYVGYCNDGNWQAAFSMLSPTCQEYGFSNDVTEFMEYVYTKMPTKKKYAIQNYSNEGKTYIYQIKYTDDLLATGLTNTTYQFTEEKMIFKRQKDGTIEMTVGNFVDYADIKNISENEYLKVDVKSVIKYYSLEAYVVKFTNRTEHTIVISDGQEKAEVLLKLDSEDTRTKTDSVGDIILEPKESKTFNLKFQKFYDNDDEAKSLDFGSIRVMENYSGTKGVSSEIIQQEIQNAIAKFSVSIPIKYKN